MGTLFTGELCPGGQYSLVNNVGGGGGGGHFVGGQRTL